MVMKLFLMCVSPNGLKNPHRDIMALKMIEGVGRWQLLNPETVANVNWLPQTLPNDSKIGGRMTVH